MRILSLLLCLLTAAKLQAQEILPGKLPISSGSYQLSELTALPDVWIIDREFTLKDARAVSLYLNAPSGTRAWFEVTSLGGAGKISQNKKKQQKRNIRKLKLRFARSWEIDFLRTDGRVNNVIEISETNEAEGLGFLFPDACSQNPKYLLRLVVDFRGANLRNFPVNLEFALSTPPVSQATLFKFPSEKSSAHAVILMRTSGVSPEYLHFTSAINGVPREAGTFPVEDYYFSNLGVFTRVYLSATYLNGQKVSMHHISADFSSIFSVCLSLQRKRQELEGYP